jgi:hypothetical protein
MLRSLVWRLWEKLEDRMVEWGKRVVEKMVESQETTSCRDFGMLWELLDAYLVDRKVVVVLDALDECTDSKALISAFSQLIGKFPQLKVAITSRRTEEIMHALEPIEKSYFEIRPEDTRDDIRRYLGGDVEKHHIF